jgi:tetratricopeptide (TPR) repeat protein
MRHPVPFALILGVILMFAGCSGPSKPEVTPQQLAQYNLRIKEAGSLLSSYNYLGLRQAHFIYRDLLAFPAFKQKTGEQYIKAALLLALREKELGIMHSQVLDQAGEWISLHPLLEGFRRYVDIVQRIPAATRGITGDSHRDAPDMDEYFEWVKQNVDPINAHLLEKSTSSDLFAYLYISFHGAYAYRFPETDTLTELAELFPVSPLVRFKLAIYPALDLQGLQSLLTMDPEFHEAELFLGDLEMQSGKVLSAEKRYLNAFAHIPESTAVVISLANVCFHLEEFDRCLEFNDMALELAPRYRDALLGRAMSLGYLNRHEEALTELQKILELGKYYIGETYYWTAWNLNELGRIDEAQSNIDKAKNYLIGHKEVASLSGLIAYQQKRLDDAEKDFTEALDLNPYDCEAAFYMGKIHAERLDWYESGTFYEKAATCNAATEAALNGKIKEIEASGMSEARKQRHIQKKKAQVLQLRRSKATSYYNAAAGFFNAKMPDKALPLAEKAAEYPLTREKAEELIATIKRDFVNNLYIFH